ncbi:phosphate starvation-inducible PhoH-like protein [Desulfohalotomaculum tongense]|uniref:PhoH family protein n=1 Tax=Desulforadius tongensis TaxID=1216062 RepID=UPI001EE57DE1|nr:PhoH family protein [Desulforadius tongensis]MBM7855718.1 phosphate starvation-inducible PhoH-like protein [Desulforadius tongensis]
MQQNTRAMITLDDIREAAEIFGRHDENLVHIEKMLDIKVVAREDKLVITGAPDSVREAEQVIEQLKDYSRAGNHITLHDINYALKVVRSGRGDKLADLAKDVVVITARGKQVKPKTQGQKQYVDAIRKYDVVFGIGPAGTGKTYLAVALAVAALRNKTVSRLVLTRPAVEAGEKLGFLPGDLQEKVDPYLRPLYDSLYDILGLETTQKYLERNIIEVAPLAYMRGRTLDNSFIILDEAQNTTPEQMKMFLTRLGFGSKAVITGDITQVDLPRGQRSGLIDAQKKLSDVEGLTFYHMTGADIVRHPLVYEIIKAYDLAEQAKTGGE